MKYKKKRRDPREAVFVREYLVDLNGTAAAKRAKYSNKTARQIASQLLSRLNVQEAIAAAMKKREVRTEITQDRVLRELAIIAYSDIKNHLDIDENTGAVRSKGFDNMPKDSSRAIESISEDRVIKENADGNSTTVYDKFKFKLHDKIKALELLGRHLGMFVTEIKLPEMPIQVIIVPESTEIKNTTNAGNKKD